ncbi:MAG: hypothetical protein SWK76_09440 [Actinomycetota bacterium]|nr:hypothetical protein [Actinomycetota bacterium]
MVELDGVAERSKPGKPPPLKLTQVEEADKIDAEEIILSDHLLYIFFSVYYFKQIT